MRMKTPRWFVHIDRKIAELKEQRPKHSLRKEYEKYSSHMSSYSGYKISSGLGI